MEEAIELYDYLPVYFRAPEEHEYIDFLSSSFEMNYREEKFQFAFLAYHMLTMSLVYFKIWQIKHAWPEDFKKGVIGFSKDHENDLLGAPSPFTFSKVPERRVFRLLKLIGWDNSKVGRYQKLVKDRNDMAHSKGHIYLKTEEVIEDKLKNILRLVHDLQVQSEIVVDNCYRDFLLHNLDPEEREYYDTSDQIREVLIHNNYMSGKDIEICIRFDISQLKDQRGFAEIRTLHNCLVDEYGPK